MKTWIDLGSEYNNATEITRLKLAGLLVTTYYNNGVIYYKCTTTKANVYKLRKAGFKQIATLKRCYNQHRTTDYILTGNVYAI